MSRFAVYPLKGSGQLVVDVQSDHLAELLSVVVVPLRLQSDYQAEPTRLNPAVEVNGKAYILLATDLSSISRRHLASPVGSLEPQRAVVVDALDFLFQGF